MPKADKLTKPQRKFLGKLSPEPDAYRSVRYEDVGLSAKGYSQLRTDGLIVEAWNWLSRTRPQVALSDAGRAALRSASPMTDEGKHASTSSENDHV
jgi:hypothetical protein